MEKNIKNNLMLDFYGNMLTEKQNEVMTLYFDCDSSLSEIADILKTTRQAIYDTVKVSENLLNTYEEKLNCVEKYLQNSELLKTCINELNEIKTSDNLNIKLKNIENKLKNVLQNQ